MHYKMLFVCIVEEKSQSRYNLASLSVTGLTDIQIYLLLKLTMAPAAAKTGTDPTTEAPQRVLNSIHRKHL